MAAAGRRAAAGVTGAWIARQAHENAYPDGNRERDQRAVFDLISEAAQCAIAQFGGIAADFCNLLAHGVGGSA